MQLYVTSEGVARAVSDQPDTLEVIDSLASDLTPYLSRDRCSELANMEPVSRIDRLSALFLPPIATPGRIIIIGLNYMSHCKEMSRPIPEQLVYFDVPGSSISSSGSEVPLPKKAPELVDYEGEIAVVIGERASRISKDRAWSVVGGITAINDISARDVQSGATTFETLGQAKGFPGFKPFGPCLATLDEFSDLSNIDIRTYVNGQLRQDSSSADMVFSIPEVIATLSESITLEAGDVICTGTPSGVALAGEHPYLVDGDIVEVEVAGLPRLSNTMVAD